MEEVKFRRSDTNRGALISTDHEGLRAYKKKKLAAAKINNMERELADIKAMMARLLEKLDK